MSQNDEEEGFAKTLFNVLLVALIVGCAFGTYAALLNGPVRPQPGMKMERTK